MIVFSKPYLLADYAEWLTVSKKRKEVSKGDLMIEAQVLDGLVDLDAPESGGGYEAAAVVRRETQLDDCFDHLEYRRNVFGKAYPFEVAGDVLSQRSVASRHRDSVLVYEFLLACGQTAKSQDVAMSFSELCKEALRRLLGTRAKVLNIDAGSADRQQIGTDTRKMARELANLLGCRSIDENIEQLTGSGDGGADLVASLQFSDQATGHVSVLGQCAASSDETYWKDKLAQAARLEALYTWSHKPTLAAFIPTVYRSSNGSWISQVNVFGSVMFDRLRIMKSLDLERLPLPVALRRSLTAAIQGTREALASRKTTKKKKRPAAKAA